jgi:penicillin amidase
MKRNRTALQGVSGPVNIERNRDGVATITANEADDALFGLGFCHARDRGLQMRLLRIIGRGQGCERLAGSDEMLALDSFFRRMNFCGDAREQEAALSPRARAGVMAYCHGVDLGFEHHGIPWELRLVGDRVKGDPWTFADVYLTAKVIGYVALALSQADVERWIVECLQHGISPAFLEELFPGQLGGLDESLLRKVRLEERIIPDALWSTAAVPLVNASNNWVVAGSKSVSGFPLLSNDPHLQIDRLPAVWYEAILRWPSGGRPRYAMGATLPGTPGVIVGRNTDVAWSVTYAFMDCADSWVEECRDGLYRRAGEWRPFRIRRETIKVRNKPPVVLDFYENEHGTLEGDPNISGFYLASRWSCGEQTGATSLDGLLGMLEARTVEEGRTRLGKLTNSSWNWLLADREGNIAYQMAGKMPLRREGVSGLIPLPGWDPANDWHGFAKLEDLPRALNPSEGFLATANDDLNDLGVRRPINLCVPSYRADRIRDLLRRPGHFTVEDMEAIQFDLYSIQAERFMAIVRPILEEMSSNENAILLHEWDCEYRNDSCAVTLFERFYRELFEEVFGGRVGHGRESGKLGSLALAYLIDETSLVNEFFGNFDRILLSEQSLWFGDRTRDEIYRTVLKRALATSAAPYGESRSVSLKHLMLGSKLPRSLGFDRGPIILSGGRATVHQGQILRSRGRTIASGPSYRFVTDLGEDTMHTTLPGGPSDRRFSRWYASGLLDWARGIYKVLQGWPDNAARLDDGTVPSDRGSRVSMEAEKVSGT